MARPDHAGGGNGGGGDDGGGSTTTTFRGTNGDDIFTITDPSMLLANIYDGRRGSDTLDLSAFTVGVTVSISGSNSSALSVEQGAVGTYFSYPGYDSLPGLVSGSLVNIENIIGGSGNDRLRTTAYSDDFLDGGAGNDLLETLGGGVDILVGGTGTDFIRGYNDDLLVGGTWDRDWSVLPTGDGQADTFENAGVILDYEGGVDRLLWEVGYDPATSNVEEQIQQIMTNPFVDGEWTDPAGNTHVAAVAYSGSHLLWTIVGMTAAEANALVAPDITLAVLAYGGGMVVGGPNDDFLLPTNDPDIFVVEDGGGNDTIVYPDTTTYTLADDVLIFPAGTAPDGLSDWVPVDVNGQDGWTYDYGTGTVTLLGVGQEEIGLLGIGEGTTADYVLLGG